MLKVKLYGAGGYGGLGLIELLLRHPEAELTALLGVSEIGKKISQIWPYLDGFCDLAVLEAGSVEAEGVEADVAVFATPDGVGQSSVAGEIAKGTKVLDYSGDFRFNNLELYNEYASCLGRDPGHKAKDLLSTSVYGLTELHREAIAVARVVGNPGCFAMSCILGLAPAVRQGCVELVGIVCDCKTGVSGAGKKPAVCFHYPEQYDNAYAYKLGGHQHIVEIEKELSLLAATQVQVTFTPQVIPMTRGIISVLYGKLPAGMSQKKVFAAYYDFYANDRFVRVLEADAFTSTGEVRGSNYVNLQVCCDERTGVFRVVSQLDNLLKGQAGSALQNINVMFGLDEHLGLDFPGMHP